MKDFFTVIWLIFAIIVYIDSKTNKKELSPFFHTASIISTIWAAS
jgi:hypothetical protein